MFNFIEKCIANIGCIADTFFLLSFEQKKIMPRKIIVDCYGVKNVFDALNSHNRCCILIWKKSKKKSEPF